MIRIVLALVFPIWALIDVPDKSIGGFIAGALIYFVYPSLLTTIDSIFGTKLGNSTDAATKPFYDSVRDDDIESVKALLEQSPEIVNEKHSDSGTALLTAAMIGNKEMVGLLLDAKANINASNSEGYTPLIYAALIGNADTVKLLLKRGANVKSANKYGMTSLGAAALGKMGREMIKESVPDAIFRESENYSSVIESLLSHGADANPKVDDGRTPLFTASGVGNIEAVRLLIGGGANINVSTPDGTTPLMIAESEGHADIVTLLRDNV